MPKYEIGGKFFVLGLLLIAALAIVAVVALGAKDVALYLIEGLFRLHATSGMEMIAS